MRSGRLFLMILVVVMCALQVSPSSASTVEGYSTLHRFVPEEPWYWITTFTSDEDIMLTSAELNFPSGDNGLALAFSSPTFYDQDGVDTYTTAGGGGSKTASFSATGFDSGDYLQLALFIGQYSTEVSSPLALVGSTLTASFSNGLTLIGTFSLATDTNARSFVQADFSSQTNPVPEPSTILLFSAALAGVGVLRKRLTK